MNSKSAGFLCFLGSGANGGPVCPVGSTLGTISVAFALLGASFWRPLGSLSGPKVENILKKISPESPWAPRGAKRTLKAPQTLQNGTQKLQKITHK